MMIGISMGCPAGIGPEIILRFLSGADPVALGRLQPVVLGDPVVLENCARQLGLPVQLAPWQPGAPWTPDALNVMPLSDLGGQVVWGQPTAATGRAAGLYIETGARLALAGELAALVTCPVSKSALQAGGYPYPGHTEMLAALCRADEYAMMMAGSRLRVTLVTIHRALAEVAAAITRSAVAELIDLTGRALRDDFGLASPRIAVAGLNPHAGEAGLFGREESEIIAPAVAAAVARGWRAFGPYPPDTVFYRAAQGDFDAVVAMYHDQGLIPFKMLHFKDGVNVTIGLPIIRTSVDHGTAYDIAGKGVADPASLAAAWQTAILIANNRKKRKGT